MTDLPPRRRTRLVTVEEAALWRLVMRDARPLHAETVPAVLALPNEPPPASPPPPPPSVASKPAPPPLPLARPLPPPPPAYLQHGHAPGVDKRTGQKLRKGRMDIDGRVDLHGMSQEIAHGALIHLVGRGFDRGLRCLLVITGKGDRTGGEGVLRRAVPRWLNEPGLREKVLSFSYAQPRDGGEGALYVLLKRRR